MRVSLPSLSEGWLLAEGLPEGVVAGTVLRNAPGFSNGAFGRCNLGLNNGDDAQHVLANRNALLPWLGLPEEPRWLRQVHGTCVSRMGLERERMPTADAAVTDQAGVVLSVLTADCLPVVFAGPGSEIGIAHAGWRGLSAGVLEATISAMHAPASELCAWLGPAIGPGSFEVGPEVMQAFVDHDVAACSAFVPAQGDRLLADLYELARLRLCAAGVMTVGGGGWDCLADAAHCHSYRRDGKLSGRMATLVWRAP